MSQGNAEIVASIYGEFALREEGLALIDPDVVIQQDPAVVGTERTYHGHAGFVQSIRDIGAAFEDMRFVPGKFTEIGDRVLATVTMTARGRESGIEVRRVLGHVWTMRDGLVVRVEAYASAAEALEAVGITE
jgi:ketosteroid isomerase-like protein